MRPRCDVPHCIRESVGLTQFTAHDRSMIIISYLCRFHMKRSQRDLDWWENLLRERIDRREPGVWVKVNP